MGKTKAKTILWLHTNHLFHYNHQLQIKEKVPMFFTVKNNLGPEGEVINPGTQVAPDAAPMPTEKALSPAANSFITRNVIVAVLMSYAKYLLKTGKVDGKDAAAAEVGKIASAAMDAGQLTAEGMEEILARVKACRVDSMAEEMRCINEKMRECLIDHMVRGCYYDKAILDTLTEDERGIITEAITAWDAYMQAQWKVFDQFGSAIDESFKAVICSYRNMFDEGFASIFCKN